MSLIETARIYRENKRLPSWAADPNAAFGPASSFSSNVTEHYDRWIFELLQNADDAGSRDGRDVTCQIFLSDKALIVADNGGGIDNEAIEALSNPFVSNKVSGTIGRKGVGFSAAYSVTSSPCIVSGDECLLFCSDRFGTWLESKSELLAITQARADYPYLYSLVPFGIRAEECAWREPSLDGWTQVCLPYRKDVHGPAICDAYAQDLRQMDFSFLLTFRHLREIVVNCRGVEVLRVRREVSNSVDELPGATFCRLLKGVAGEDFEVLGAYACWSKQVEAPDDILLGSVPDSRTRKLMKSTQIRVMAPLTEEVLVYVAKPAGTKFLVFYPTEEDAPTRTLLHAEFLVENNRKRILSPDACPLNLWLLEQLTSFLVDCADALSKSGCWKAALALLQPAESDALRNSGIAGKLWEQVRTKALAGLALPTKAEQREPLSRIYVPESDLSLAAIEALVALREPTLVQVGDEIAMDKTARNVLEALGGKIITTKRVLEWLETPPNNLQDRDLLEWAWSGWLYLAAWRKNHPNDDYGWLRRVKLLPVDGRLQAKGIDLCWESEPEGEQIAQELPDWLPLRRLSQLLIEKLRGESPSELRDVLRELGIQPLEGKHVLQALKVAADRYWTTSGTSRMPPEKLLLFLAAQPWLETALENGLFGVELGAVPVRTKLETWRRANDCYFGNDWGNEELALVYRDEVDVPWLASDSMDKRLMFEALGVSNAPRLVNTHSTEYLDTNFWARVKAKMPIYWQTNRKAPEGRCENLLSIRSETKCFDKINLDNLDQVQQMALLRLVFRHWHRYQTYKDLQLQYSYYGQMKVAIENKWWWDLRKTVVPAQNRGILATQPQKLEACWSPLYSPKWVRSLLPTIAPHQIVNPDEEAKFNDWLRDNRVVRSDASDIAHSEWSVFAHALVKALAEHEPKEQRKFMMQFYSGYLASPTTPLRTAPCFGQDGLKLHQANEVYVTHNESEIDRWTPKVPVALTDRRDVAPATEKLNLRRLEYKASMPNEVLLERRDDLTSRIQHALPYMYSYEKRRRERSGLSPKQWKLLTCYAAQEVRVVLQLNSDPAIQMEERWLVFGCPEPRQIVVDGSRAEEFMTIALGLRYALALSRESTNFTEILLSLADVKRMRSRLRTEGVEEHEIEEDLAEFEEREESLWEPIGAPPEKPSPQPIRTTQDPGPSQVQSPCNDQRDLPKKDGTRGDADAGGPVVGGGGVNLKNPDSEYVLQDVPAPSIRTPGNKVNGADVETETIITEEVLDEAVRRRIEELSRSVIERRLPEIWGVSAKITQLHYLNEGYDIEVEANGETWRIEAKGHQRTVRVEELTAAEFECYKNAKQDGYRWELWSVQNLSADTSEPITITRIRDIPVDAIAAKTYRVRLSECEAVESKQLM